MILQKLFLGEKLKVERKSIIYFTKYSPEGPSSRYRSFNYKKILEDKFHVEFSPLFDEEYIFQYTKGRVNMFKIFSYYVLRIIVVLKHLGTQKIVFIEYELLPFFPPILEFLLVKSGVKIIYDFDDAIFHNYDLHPRFIVRLFYGNKIYNLVKSADLVISGSPYLTKCLSKFNKNVVELPTSITFSKYELNFLTSSKHDGIVIGWIGSKSTSTHILSIFEVINLISILQPEITFKLMGFDQNLRAKMCLPNVKFLNWSEENELIFLNEIDLGIMPLTDTPFNRGKCGFKLIQYMAMGKPTLSTPFEANIKINRNSHNLFASSTDEWVSCIREFSRNRAFYKDVGLKNREIVKEFYSVEANGLEYVKIFNRILDVRN